jgi:hypothetical protein
VAAPVAAAAAAVSVPAAGAESSTGRLLALLEVMNVLSNRQPH